MATNLQKILFLMHCVLGSSQLIHFALPNVKHVGTECKTSHKSFGYCTSILDCPADRFIKNIEDICYFEGINPIVCCALETTQSHIKSELFQRLKLPNDPKLDSQNGIFVRMRTSNHIADKQCLSFLFPLIDARSDLKARIDYITSTEPSWLKGSTKMAKGELSILGGQPHMVAIGWRSNLNNEIVWKCGGTLISANFVLTAAHCVEDTNDKPDLVKIGEIDLIKNQNPIAQNCNVTDVIVHPSFKTGFFYHDIALLKISPHVSDNLFIRPSCLWTESNIPVYEFIAMGYGTDSFGGRQRNQLYEGNLTLIENDKCQSVLGVRDGMPNGLTNNQICAKDIKGNTDTCQGDSGGPLLFKTVSFETTAYHVVGITSFGDASCGGTSPGVYTRVSSYIDWIESIVWQ